MSQTYEDRLTLEAWNALESAVAGKAQIATGSYTGTGEYDEANPNSLTFDFIPKMVLIYDTLGMNVYANSRGGSWSGCLMWSAGQTTAQVLSSVAGSFTQVYFTLAGTTLSWYGTEAWAQCNYPKTYYYLAIG